MKLRSIERFTDIGGGLVKCEQGTLNRDADGFVANSSGNYPASIFSLSAETLASISGKTVMSLGFWLLFESYFNLREFQRSAQTYSVCNVDYVIVGAKNTVQPDFMARIADILKLNISDVSSYSNVCPRPLSPRADTDSDCV